MITSIASAVLLIAAAAGPLVLEDPRGDDNGPGGYQMPSSDAYRPGDFDLRRFAVTVEGDSAVIEVTLGTAIRREVVQQRTNAADLDLANGIWVQHVDIYVDTTPGQGFTQGLPGRRIAFAPEEAWDTAISLTPQPARTRAVLESWNRDAAMHVVTPGPIRSSGARLKVRIPLWQLGGKPQPTWGWSVMVSGAVWELSFDTLSRIRGLHEADAYTMPVYAVPEDQAFGGAKLNGGHPYVIDVILPPGVAQADVLGSFGADRPAVVPMVYQQRPVRPDAGVEVAVVADAGPADAGVAFAVVADAGPADAGASEEAAAVVPASDAGTSDRPALILTPSAPAVERASDLLVFEIANLQGDTAIIPTPGGGVKAWQIGTVVNKLGQQIGRVVVTQISNGFVLATVTEGRSSVGVGSQVRFTRAQ